jgi:hypothetical protein
MSDPEMLQLQLQVKADELVKPYCARLGSDTFTLREAVIGAMQWARTLDPRPAFYAAEPRL